jgi:sarcosine oxidase subunit delta
MRIPCPHCGSRASHEFTVLGGADPVRPAADAPMQAWHDYVYLRDNVAGPTREYWHHSQGCRQWLVVSRDTRTHEVFGAEACRR